MFVLHQWEALDITHSCSSKHGVSRSHRIEWRDNLINIIDSNFSRDHLIHWDELSYYLIKNIDIVNISYQKLVYITYIIYVKAPRDYPIISDIKKVQSSHSITQSLSINYSSIYDSFGTIMIEGIDLSSVARDYTLIQLIDFVKQSSVDNLITLNHNILKKKDFNISTDIYILNIFDLNIIPFFSTFITLIVNISHFCDTNILEYITYTQLLLLSNISVNKELIIFTQEDTYIFDNITQIDIYNTHILSNYLIDISSQNTNTLSLMDYFINKIIIEFVINLQHQDITCSHFIHHLKQHEPNIVCQTNSASNIHHRVDHLQYITFNLFEKYITFNLTINLVFNLTFNIIYVNQVIIELYSTIFETHTIRNVHAFVITYQDIKIDECYINISGTGILVYANAIIVELIDIIQNWTKTIIYKEVILSAYVIIRTSEIDNIIMAIKGISLLSITIMKLEEITKLILENILISRIEGDVVTNFWPSHREGV